MELLSRLESPREGRPLCGALESSPRLALAYRRREAKGVMNNPPSIAIVIPAYRVAASIADVIARVPPDVRHIIVVDDGSRRLTITSPLVWRRSAGGTRRSGTPRRRSASTRPCSSPGTI